MALSQTHTKCCHFQFLTNHSFHPTLYANVEHSICQCPTGSLLKHFPTETTLQLFTGMSSFSFRSRKPEGSTIAFGFTFTGTNGDMKIAGDKNTSLCSRSNCSLQAQRMEQRLDNRCLLHIAQARSKEMWRFCLLPKCVSQQRRKWIQI